MTAIPMIGDQYLQAICDALGDTSTGLSGSEIGRLLGQCGINDLLPDGTKRYRLYQALNARQHGDQCANNILAFVLAAMNPVRYVDHPDVFTQRKDRLNQVLAFVGYQITEDGKLRQVIEARTLTEAEQRAGRLRSELMRRNVHPDVIRFCRAELLGENYFHAVLEATKSVGDKVRDKTGLTSDGSSLVDEAFGLKTGPKLAFNTLRTESEMSEHVGLMNLMKAAFSMYRNPTAHAPKISWCMTEQDALDLLTLVSLIHRRLDQAVKTGK